MRDLSNCLFFAVALFWRRRWKGYLVIRKSRWGGFPHFLYLEGKHIISYKPVDPTKHKCPPPLFVGRVAWGDEASGPAPLE